jgi:hypothetical protein
MPIDDPSIVIAGYGAVELYDGYRPAIGDRGGMLAKRYLCDWDDAVPLANAMMGVSSAALVGGSINRVLPHQCPEFTNLFCQSVEIEPAEAPLATGGRPAWTAAIITASYGPFPFNNGAGGDASGDPNNMMSPDGTNVYPFCDISINLTTQHVSVPGTSFMALGSTKPYGQPITLRIGLANMHVQIHSVPYFPADAILSLAGKVNNGIFLGRPAESILFEGATSNKKIDSVGNISMDIGLTFIYRSVSWNKAPDVVPAAGADFVLLTSDGTSGGRKMYEAADLRPLIFGASLL